MYSVPSAHIVTLPSADISALQTFDSYLMSAITKITNSALSVIQLCQLHSAHGGLGVRTLLSRATHAFLYSAVSTLLLQNHILSLASFFIHFFPVFYNVQLIRSSFFNSGRINSKRSDIAIASRGKNLLRFDRDITMIMVSPFLLPRDAVHPRY